MRFLVTERETLERLLPRLDGDLAEYSLAELERPNGPAIPVFRAAHGSGLLVPAEHGGVGASPVDAVRCTRAIGSRSPSLGVAATMHNFSVAGLVALCERSDGMEWMLLDAIAHDRLLVASALAEGRTGQGILSPTMRAVRVDREWRVSGRKKPCSLSRSADIITASVALSAGGGEDGVGIALIPRHSEGISVRPFWSSSVLTGAESDELVLDAVPVEDQLMVPLDPDPDGADDLQTVGLIWFTVLISGAYLGAASGLAERLLLAGRGTAELRTDVIAELEGAMLALERVAGTVDAGETGADSLARALVARRITQGAIQRVVNRTVEAIGAAHPRRRGVLELRRIRRVHSRCHTSARHRSGCRAGTKTPSVVACPAGSDVRGGGSYADRSLSASLSRVYFTGSGAEAAEAAIKLARAHGKRRLITTDGGYHGKTMGALSVTARDLYQAPFRPLLPSVERIPYGNAEALADLLADGVPSCFVVEPIQGEGGVVIPPAGYLSEVTDICRRHECLLTVDEILTGLGRLGRWWGVDADGVTPDIMLVGKSLSGGDGGGPGGGRDDPGGERRRGGGRDRRTAHRRTTPLGGRSLSAPGAGDPR